MGGAPTWRGVAALTRLGFPAAVQVTLEVGVFALATMFAGVLGPVPLAAHQIALMACSVWFMVPLGISSAGAVRVGHAVGRGDPAGATRAGWTALGLAMAVTGIGVTAFLVLPRTIVGAFTADAEVIRMGVILLAVAAAFEFCDGLQVVATGTLRGLGDTRTPMFVNLVAHWGVGLPIGWWLGLRGGWGVVGLWAGLALGLIVAGAVLLLTWAIRTSPSHRGRLVAVVGGVEG
jgi:MATE family multidrug resistance protein